MPNPQGINPFQPQPKYGEVKKQETLTKSAPMSGAPVPAVTAPQKAQSRAVQGRVSPPKAPKASGGTPLPYEEELVLTWQEIAAQPGASELVKSIARRAQGMPRGV
jgi:hypothetical protein